MSKGRSWFCLWQSFLFQASVCKLYIFLSWGIFLSALITMIRWSSLRNVFFSHGFVSCTAFGLVCFLFLLHNAMIGWSCLRNVFFSKGFVSCTAEKPREWRICVGSSNLCSTLPTLGYCHCFLGSFDFFKSNFLKVPVSWWGTFLHATLG